MSVFLGVVWALCSVGHLYAYALGLREDGLTFGVLFGAVSWLAFYKADQP